MKMVQKREDEETSRLDSEMILKSEIQINICTIQRRELKRLAAINDKRGEAPKVKQLQN